MLKEVIKNDMMKRGLSIREYAKMAGVSHSTIFRALQGESIDVDTAIGLAKWLKVKPSELLNSLDQSDNAISEKLALLVEHFPTLKLAFEKIVEVVERDEVDPSIVEDIAGYILYRLELAKKLQELS